MPILDFLFPRKCLGCKRAGGYVCSRCVKKVRLHKQICIECERPAVDGVTHLSCRRPLGLDRAVSIWRYEGVIRTLVLRMKYGFASDVARELAAHAVSFLKQEQNLFPEEALLIPVPLAKRRGNWRGFNQAEVVGSYVSSSMGWKYSDGVLLRKVSRRPQTELKEKERIANVRGVFTLNSKSLNAEGCNSVVLFDDVLTTGATLKEAGKILKRGGANKVLGLTIAK